MNMSNARAQLKAFDPNAEEDGFVDQKRLSSAQEQTITKVATWTKVRMDEDSADGAKFAIVKGPCHYIFDIALTTDPLQPGKSVMLRSVSTGDDPDEVETVQPIAQFGATDSGPQHFAYSSQGWLPEGQWLRAQVNTDGPLTITKAETRVTTW